MLRPVTIFGLLVLCFSSQAQDEVSYAEQLKALEGELDSLSIFNLIDSLFDTEVLPASELNVRLGFTTNVTSAGRDYNISQSGFAPAVSYYHRSGLYGDLAGYWNSGVDPSYNPTVFSLGYLGTFENPKWSFSIDSERWFYNPNDSSNNPLFYSLGASLSYDFKFGFASVDYSLLFGNASANRIIFNLSGNIPLGKWWVFENINLYPSAGMMIGNSDITQLRITNRQLSEQNAERISRIVSFSELNEDQRRFMASLIIRSFRNGVITVDERNTLLQDLSTASNLSDESINALNEIANEGFPVSEFVESSEFGVLNYAFTLPLSLSIGRVNLLLSYTYSIPIQVPNEFIEVDPIGYFGASVSYRIPFK